VVKIVVTYFHINLWEVIVNMIRSLLIISYKGMVIQRSTRDIGSVGVGSNPTLTFFFRVFCGVLALSKFQTFFVQN